MDQIYSCRPSFEEDRPVIDFEDAENRANDWLVIGDVVDGTRPIADYPCVTVKVRHPEATEWDCYTDGIHRGLFSQRFVDAVGLPSLHGLTLMPALLNGVRYFFFRREAGVDCLDREHSVLKFFKHDPTRIMDVLHYEFREGAVPEDACFVQVQSPKLLLTESVAQRIQAAGLKGVRILPLP